MGGELDGRIRCWAHEKWARLAFEVLIEKRKRVVIDQSIHLERGQWPRKKGGDARGKVGKTPMGCACDLHPITRSLGWFR